MNTKLSHGFIVLITLLSLISTSCSDKNEDPTVVSEWLINQEEVLDGGPGKDGIPSLDIPLYRPASSINFLKDSDLVLAVYYDNDPVAYSHRLLDWHEIINDDKNDQSVAVTYCPLTGTGMAWDRMVDGQITEFGVSGLLYNSNLMPYDRNSNSTWSQIRQDCVNGQLIDTKINQIQMIEMRWDAYKKAFPEGDVVDQNTTFDRDYDSYPYGDYRTNNDRIIFPINGLDDQLPSKQRVLGVIDGDDVTIFTFDKLEENNGLITTTVGLETIIVFGDSDHNCINAMTINTADKDKYSYNQESFPNVIQYDGEVKFNLFGKSIDATSTDLIYRENFLGYYLAFPGFFESVTIY